MSDKIPKGWLKALETAKTIMDATEPDPGNFMVAQLMLWADARMSLLEQELVVLREAVRVSQETGEPIPPCFRPLRERGSGRVH